jgi:hypothetical protein
LTRSFKSKLTELYLTLNPSHYTNDCANLDIQNHFRIEPKEMDRSDSGPTQPFAKSYQSTQLCPILAKKFSVQIECNQRENAHSKQNKIVFGKLKSTRLFLVY